MLKLKLIQTCTQQPLSSSPMHVKLGSRTLNLQCLKDRLLVSPTMDLKVCASQYYCEGMITIVLSAYLCGSHTSNQTVSKQSSTALATKSHRRFCSSRKSPSSNMEYPKATSYMTGEVKREQLVVTSEDSDVVPSIGYIALAHDLKQSRSRSAIATSRALSSSVEREEFACMTSTPKENQAHQLET